MTDSRATALALSRMLRKYFLTAIVLVGAGDSVVVAAPLQATLPPVVEWHGASEKLIVRDDDPWVTPAERDDFRTSPDAGQTFAWLERLAAASPWVELEIIGHTSEGRGIVAARVTKGMDARDVARPVVLVQAGIHSGEIEGKDAGLMLLRDIALRGKDDLLDAVDLIFVPIYSLDGHERAHEFNRPNQRGPQRQGWRTTARNINLNRDYVAADAPETRAMLKLIQRSRPSLYIDIHATDGSDSQYDVMFTFNGWDGLYARSPAIGRWLDTRFRPAVMQGLARAGHTPRGFVETRNRRDPAEGIVRAAFGARYSHGYGDTAHIPSVIVETHALKPYRQRVLGTYVLMENALRVVGKSFRELATAIEADSAIRPSSLVLSWSTQSEPSGHEEWLGRAHEEFLSPASGRLELRWLGKPITQRAPLYLQEPAVVSRMPRAWWIPVSEPETIERLGLHGVKFEQLEEARTLTLDVVRLSEPKLGQPGNGRIPLHAADIKHAMEEIELPRGSVRVPADQPLGLLAASMLEPESPDSLLAAGFFQQILSRTGYIEGYVIAPLADAMLAADSSLKSQFEAALRADQQLATDPERRLEWFYARTPYYDARYLRYPVARELAE